MYKREWKLFLTDIKESSEKVLIYTQNMNFEEFSRNDLIKDAVARNLEIIGEAFKHIPDSVKTRHTAIPWQEIAGLRNILIHAYFGINLRILWDIITNEIPPLLENIEIIFRDKHD